MPWEPLPPVTTLPIPQHRGKFIDIEVFGHITANTGTLVDLDIIGTLTMETGGIFRTASSGTRIEFLSSTANIIYFYSGDAAEVEEGELQVGVSGSGDTRTIQWGFKAPRVDADDERATITLRSGSPDGTTWAPGIIFSRLAGSGGQDAYVGLEGNLDLVLSSGSGLTLPDGKAALTWANWQSWTPTYTNFTLGNGVVSYAQYAQIGDLVIVHFRILFGSTTSIDASDPRFSLPVTAATGYGTTDYFGTCELFDSGTAHVAGMVRAWTTSQFNITCLDVASTYAKHVAISATIPFTWTTSDRIGCTFAYRAA
jgi:hypothetical protein